MPRPERRDHCRAGRRSGAQNCGGLSDLTPQSDKNVSRETVLSDWGRKPYKTTYVRQGEARAIARKLGLFGGCRVRLRAGAGFDP